MIEFIKALITGDDAALLGAALTLLGAAVTVTAAYFEAPTLVHRIVVERPGRSIILIKSFEPARIDGDLLLQIRVSSQVKTARVLGRGVVVSSDEDGDLLLVRVANLAAQGTIGLDLEFFEAAGQVTELRVASDSPVQPRGRAIPHVTTWGVTRYKRLAVHASTLFMATAGGLLFSLFWLRKLGPDTMAAQVMVEPTLDKMPFVAIALFLSLLQAFLGARWRGRTFVVGPHAWLTTGRTVSIRPSSRTKATDEPSAAG